MDPTCPRQHFAASLLYKCLPARGGGGCSYRKRICEADWDNGRTDSCDIDGDNFASNSSGTEQVCSSVQDFKAAWDSERVDSCEVDGDNFASNSTGTEWDNGRADSCELDGDNFASNSSGTEQECSSFQDFKSAWDSCKRRKCDLEKVKYEVSVTHEAESSSTSVLTVGGEAFICKASSVEHTSHDFALLGDKIIKLDVIDHEFKMVQDKFYTGLGMLASYTTIKGIYKDCHRSTTGQARLQAFRRQEEITRAARGDSNVRYAWHGTSKPGISVIVLHGFGQPRIPKNGAMYGVGVYLAPEDYSHVSAVYSDVDENGEQHMVLCRVIMGNMEQVEQGSEQFHPTSEDYDTGVDDIHNPKRYVVWSTHMNTHILPEYMISFKLAPPWNDIIAALRGKNSVGKPVLTGKGLQFDGRLAECNTPPKTSFGTCNPVPDSLVVDQGLTPKSCRAPRSPWMSFPMLFLVMKAKLSEAQMCELQQHYLQFKIGKMPRNELIKVVRRIAGDRLLADSIRSMQAQERASNGRSAAKIGCMVGELQVEQDLEAPSRLVVAVSVSTCSAWSTLGEDCDFGVVIIQR